jgi:TM2 domain-containing membrane protein YozV
MKYPIAILLAWLVPGLGHIFVGKVVKGLFFLVILSATYIFGLYLTNFRTISPEDNLFYFIPNYGSGATLFLGNLLSTQKPFPRQNLISWYDAGILYVCISGLLNMMLVLNIFKLARTKIQTPEVASEAPSNPTGPV